MNKKQYNNVIEYTLKHEQCEDSLGTARAVFNNMGVALPQGDLAQVKETLETNDYMGWQSCTMEEAQAAADSGVAAIGISDERIVVLSANDEEQPVAATASVMSIDENTTEIASYGMDYYTYSNCSTTIPPEMPNTKERVTISDDDGVNNKVTFHNSGKVWRCVNNEMIYNQDNLYNTYLRPRAQFNICPDPRVDPIKTYTDEELKLLYAIDPYGVAYYVKEYSYIYAEENYNSNIADDRLRKQIEYKDYIFELLYGREPQYFDRDTNGNLHLTLSRDLDEVFSESETLFGMHSLNDEVTFLATINLILDIVSFVAGCSGLFKNATLKVIQKVVAISLEAISLGEALLNREFESYIIGNAFDEGLELFKIDWINCIMSLCDSLEAAAGYVINNCNLERDVLSHCASNESFDVYVQLRNGTYLLQEILDSIEDV